MGTTDRSSRTPAKPAAAPEALARLVLHCRDAASILEESLTKLPERPEAPFLFGQLDAVIERLHASLRAYTRPEAAPEKGGGFLRLFSGRREREPAQRSDPRYDLEGNAWTIPVTELVGFLSHSGKSGLLWVTSPNETFVLEFARGSLVHATSNAPPAAFRLGEILLSEKLLPPEELAQVIEHARAADDLLGSYLLRSGRLRHADLQRVLSIQVQQLFHRLMDADNAFYRFQEGGQLLKSHGLEVNITQLLLESARLKDEERQRSDSARVAPADPLGVLDTPAGVGPRPALPAVEPVAEATEKRPEAAGSAAGQT